MSDGSYREKVNAQVRQRKKEDKLPRIRNGKSWSLQDGVQLASEAVHGARPYPFDSKEQMEWWDKQKVGGIIPSRRKILMDVSGCPHRTKKMSPTINTMQSRGKTEETSKKRKREKYQKQSEMNMGRDQKHAVEGCAIHMVFDFLLRHIPNFDNMWEALPVFDGLEADFMMRHKNWPSNEWVPIQMKSATGCTNGKKINYNLKNGEYKNIFCICVGMVDYTSHIPTSPDDISLDGCTIGEIWNIGSSSKIEKSLQPTFGVPYSKCAPEYRLQMSSASDEEKRSFAQTIIRDIEAWEHRFSQERIFYEFSNTINKRVGEMHRVEKKGFQFLDEQLRKCGLYVSPVWRQNECVDYAIADLKTNKNLVYVSGKTGSGNLKQRYFELSKAPNDNFCDCVIASYSGLLHRVAVMNRTTVYDTTKKTFYWNDNKINPGVRVFDDIRNVEVAREFAEYIKTFAK